MLVGNIKIEEDEEILLLLLLPIIIKSLIFVALGGLSYLLSFFLIFFIKLKKH